jgi:hypothetical protein
MTDWDTRARAVGLLPFEHEDQDDHARTWKSRIVEEERHIAVRLESLRDEIRGEQISYGEIAELQDYGARGLIPADDVELREWAGLPEHADA